MIGTAIDITRYSMNIRARATDQDGDQLTYTLHWGETSNLGNTQTIKANEGTEVKFAKTGLGMDKMYYWRIDVTDGIDTVRGQLKSR